MSGAAVAAPPKSTAYIGSIYEDTTGASGVLSGFGKGVRWELIGVGCDGVFVGRAGEGRARLVDYGSRYKLVKKGKGDAVSGWWQFHAGNVSLPFSCKHGEAVASGAEKPRCVDCLIYLKLAKAKETEYKQRARALWKTAY